MKTETLFLVKARQDQWLRANGLRRVLSCLFTRNLHLIDLAEKILSEIKARKQVPASEWGVLLTKCTIIVEGGRMTRFEIPVLKTPILPVLT